MTIVERVESWAAANGRAAAVTDGAGTFSYLDLVTKAHSIADALREKGVQPGEAVGLTAGRRREVLASMIATQMLGVAYVPIDLEWPRPRVEEVREDAGLRVVVTAEDDASGLEGLDVGVLDVVNQTWLSDAGTQGPVTNPDQLAYVLYTSGSTGRPKGVEIPRSSMSGLFEANDAWLPMSPDDVGVCFHSITFDVSVWEIFRPLTSGAHVVVCDRKAMLDPSRVADWIQATSGTHLCQTPTAFRALSRALLDGGVGAPSLRRIFLAGEALRFGDLADWFDAFDDDRPEVWNVYGPTEATVYSTAYRVRKGDVADDRSIIGRPLAHVRTAVAPAPDHAGAAGELELSGAIALRYRNLPELTDERFPVREGRRWFATRDLVKRTSEGDYVFLGRLDNQVKVRGFRVELEEIEVHARRHRQVRDCVAVAVGPGGSAEDIVLAAVPADGATLDDHDLRVFLAGVLPRHMRPSRILKLGGLPLNTSGKLDRGASKHLVSDLLEEEVAGSPRR